MSKKFEAIVKSTPEENIIELVGHLDETGSFPTFRDSKPIRLKCLGLKSINSFGVKIWCQWVKAHEGSVVSLDHCPFVLVRHFKAVKNFLTPNMSVVSFYVPYVSDETSEKNDILYLREIDFTPSGKVTIKKVFDSNGNEMEIDVNEKSYFGFLIKEA